MQDVPVDGDCREYSESGDAVMLALGIAVLDLSLATDAQRILESVVGIALNPNWVRRCMSVSRMHSIIRLSDATHLPQRSRQLILARV